MIIDCILTLPPHHSLDIQHNQHKSYYEHINDYLGQEHIKGSISFEEAQKCLETDEIWVIQLYPFTPIGFRISCGASLPEAVRLMNLNYKDGNWL